MTATTQPSAPRQDSTKRVLLIYGGWRGHTPGRFADYACDQLLTDYEVVRSRSLDVLTDPKLKAFDLILPIWTFGTLSARQEAALLRAVQNGLGYVGWHGNASSFLESRPHRFLLGGQFVGHPGGNHIQYKSHSGVTTPSWAT